MFEGYETPKLKLEVTLQEVTNTVTANFAYKGSTYSINLPNEKDAWQLLNFFNRCLDISRTEGKQEVVNAVSHSLKYFVRLK